MTNEHDVLVCVPDVWQDPKKDIAPTVAALTGELQDKPYTSLVIRFISKLEDAGLVDRQDATDPKDFPHYRLSAAGLVRQTTLFVEGRYNIEAVERARQKAKEKML